MQTAFNLLARLQTSIFLFQDDSEEQLRENPECMLLLSPTIPRKVPAHSK